MKRSVSTIAFSLAILSACASADPPPPAVTSFAPAAVCSDAPSLAAAASLTPENPAGRMEMIVDIGAEAPCLRHASGANAPYAIFALPTEGKVASISAGALLEEHRLFAPSVSTLGADGRVLRTFAADAFSQRGRTIAVLFAPRAGETYLLIAAEPSKVGSAHPLVAVDPASVATPVHLKQVEQIVAFKANLSRPYSYAGQVFARVYFADPAPK